MEARVPSVEVMKLNKMLYSKYFLQNRLCNYKDILELYATFQVLKISLKSLLGFKYLYIKQLKAEK